MYYIYVQTQTYFKRETRHLYVKLFVVFVLFLVKAVIKPVLQNTTISSYRAMCESVKDVEKEVN